MTRLNRGRHEALHRELLGAISSLEHTSGNVSLMWYVSGLWKITR